MGNYVPTFNNIHSKLKQKNTYFDGKKSVALKYFRKLFFLDKKGLTK